MKFTFKSPIGRTLDSILADAKKLLRNHGRLMPRRRSSGRAYPSQAFADMLSHGLPRNGDGQWSSPESTRRYLAEFLRLNHFR